MFKVFMEETGLSARVAHVKAFFEAAKLMTTFNIYVKPFVYEERNNVTELHNEIFATEFNTALELAMDEKCLPGIEVVQNGGSGPWIVDAVREVWRLPQGWTPEPGAMNSVRTIHVNGTNHCVEMPIGCWCQCIRSQTHSIQVTSGPDLYVKDLKIIANRHEDTGSLLLFYAESPSRLTLENVKVLAPADSVDRCFPRGNVYLDNFEFFGA